MKQLALAVGTLLFGAGAASAAETAAGSGALALAALVGLQSPAVSAADKHTLESLLEGQLGFQTTTKIKVKAASVSCRSSDVDIAHHDCALTFGGSSRTLKGRAAHELYATLVEDGIPSDGAAGSIYETLSTLSCTVDTAVVKQRGGGGADCSYQSGPGS